MPRYIDADALIFKLEMQDYSCAPDTLEDWTPEDMTKAEIADIEHAPTADVVEVKHGKWIYSIKPLAGGRYVSGRICSVCKKRILHHRKSNFCPNCGARMEVE